MLYYNLYGGYFNYSSFKFCWYQNNRKKITIGLAIKNEKSFSNKYISYRRGKHFKNTIKKKKKPSI